MDSQHENQEVSHSCSLSAAWQSLAPALQETAEAALPTDWSNVLPARENVFRAFDLVAPESARCVILGQDPYPTRGHAMGLAFSVPQGQSWAKSLLNIGKEFQSDLGIPLRSTDLTAWALAGCLLANTALTVLEGQPGAHAGQWQSFTRQWIAALRDLDQPRVWVLWGNHAQKFGPLIRASGSRKQVTIETAHPSPLSAYRGFFGSRPFSRINAELTRMGAEPIDWYSVNATQTRLPHMERLSAQCTAQLDLLSDR